MIDDKNFDIGEKLLKVAKPGRYIGNEINMVKKDPATVKIRFALLFPDVYEVGMSHLGLQILYFFLNRREDCYCERAFMPWSDMIRILDDRPLWSLETTTPLKNFDFIGFTLQHELTFTNMLAMLDLAGIPLRSTDRDEGFPIICAGGPCSYNPEPVADFIDFFVIGDGEAILDEIMDIYNEQHSKADFLLRISKLTGVYVPAFYRAEYDEEGLLSDFSPINSAAPPTIKKAVIQSLDTAFFPQTPLTPLIETAHNRAALELFRGCKRGCRFCQAGYTGRPIRYRKPITLLAQAKETLQSTGHEEISLMSLSTADYPDFMPFLDDLLAITEEKKVNISLPSLRIDSISIEAMQKTQKVRKSSLTFAPEAGTNRLRRAIRKDITESDIQNGVVAAFEAGYDRLKLYFMVGLPTETYEDIDAIANTAHSIVDEYYKLPKPLRRRPPSINISCSCFVPKPFTPFQWAAQDTLELLMDKQRRLKSKIQKKQISYRYHDSYTAIVEGVLARGDRRISYAIEAAYRAGAIFDGWSEFFSLDIWKTAFAATNINPDFYTHRERKTTELLPWDFIDIGIPKDFFVQEWEKTNEILD
ncbi:MAG: TIGR03960 family B12-binding radical SAM protein [Turicibacter sp.]|nr:TIGR03960 family B12-binding radical SAM protein [Turicibacter sp.]